MIKYPITGETKSNNDQEVKVLFGGTILVDGSSAISYLFPPEIIHQNPTASFNSINTHNMMCDNDGLVKKVNYLMQLTNKTVLLDPIDTDLVPPTAHWGSKMNRKIQWVQCHVERRKPNQEEWTDEEWVDVPQTS